MKLTSIFLLLFSCALNAQSFRNASASFSGASNASAITIWTTSAHYSPEQFNRVVNAGTQMQSAAEAEIDNLQSRNATLNTTITSLREELQRYQQTAAAVVPIPNRNEPSTATEPTMGDDDEPKVNKRKASLQATIIEFVMDNLLLVLILIGGVYYYIKKRKAGEPLF